MKPEAWTNEQIEELRRLRGEGVELKVIAERLGKTKGSVDHKARRLKIRLTVPVKKPTALQRVELKPPPPKIIHLPKSVPTCQWPIGAVKSSDFRFCGAPSKENRPYCEDHCNIAYAPYKTVKTA
jgi:GcrA cell cycle regulator